jgi:hypothetical protein
VTRRFEMTIQAADFRRRLPGALGAETFEECGDAFLHSEAGRSWRIELGPLPALALGAISLERQLVQWTFAGYEAAEIQVRLERFERHFRRGGG